MLGLFRIWRFRLAGQRLGSWAGAPVRSNPASPTLLKASAVMQGLFRFWRLFLYQTKPAVCTEGLVVELLVELTPSLGRLVEAGDGKAVLTQ